MRMARGGAGLIIKKFASLDRIIDSTSNHHALGDGAGWVGEISTSPSDRQIVDDGDVEVGCSFSAPAPDGGSFTLSVNDNLAYAGMQSVHLRTRLVAGWQHSVSCRVYDTYPGGRVISQRTFSFVVRHGSSKGGESAAVLGLGRVEWIQRHDSCGEDWHMPAVQDTVAVEGGHNVAAAANYWCPANHGHEVEGIVEHKTPYPPHAERLMEEHFMEFYMSNSHRFPSDYIYVPIAWISHAHNFQLARETYHPNPLDLAQHILLHYSDPSLRYFTVTQADYWPQDVLEVLPSNWMIFSAACTGHWPLLLSTQFHLSPPLSLASGPVQKKFLASFVGRDTHFLRRRLACLYKDDPEILIVSGPFMIGTDNQQTFREITTRSVFTLAPRGNGPSSFRIFEALEHGSIPVYIHDSDYCLPAADGVKWDTFALVVSSSNLVHLKSILESFDRDDISEMQASGQRALDSFFSLNATHEYVLSVLDTIHASSSWLVPSEPPRAPDACWGGWHSKETSQENDGEGTNGAEEASVFAAVERMRSRLPNQRVIKPLGNILLLQCIASGWSNEDACDEARQLIELGREGGEGGLYFSGLGEALLQMNPTAAENRFLDSILASPTTSQGLEGLEMVHGRGSDEVMRALKRIGYWDDRQKLRGWREIGNRPVGSVCVPPLESEWGAGVAVILLARSLVVCSAVERAQTLDVEESAGPRDLVVPEEWMSYFSQEQMKAACGGGSIVGTDALDREAHRRMFDGVQGIMTGKVLYSSPCFAIRDGCKVGIYRDFEVSWATPSPLVPLHSLRDSWQGYISSADVERMSRSDASYHVIAFERVPPISELKPIEECAGFHHPDSMYGRKGTKEERETQATARCGMCGNLDASDSLVSVLRAATIMDLGEVGEEAADREKKQDGVEEGDDEGAEGLCAVIYADEACVDAGIEAARNLSDSSQCRVQVFLSEREIASYNGVDYDMGTFEGIAALQKASCKARFFAGMFGSPVTAAAMIARSGLGIPLSASASFVC